MNSAGCSEVLVRLRWWQQHLLHPCWMPCRSQQCNPASSNGKARHKEGLSETNLSPHRHNLPWPGVHKRAATSTKTAVDGTAMAAMALHPEAKGMTSVLIPPECRPSKNTNNKIITKAICKLATALNFKDLLQDAHIQLDIHTLELQRRTAR